jgi:hypothetical protein
MTAMLLSCNDCGKTQEAETGECPNCGSKNTFWNVPAAWLMPMGGIKISMVVRHRMWVYLPAGIEESLQGAVNAATPFKTKGSCLSAIGSSAFLVEGIVTDYLEMELNARKSRGENEANLDDELAGLEHIGWDKKLKKASRLGWNLEGLEGYDMVEVLFSLRGNLVHGRTYTMIDPRMLIDNAWRRPEPVQIQNESYYKVYQKLFELGLAPSLEDMPGLSVEVFLTAPVARFLYEAALKYIKSFIDTIILSSGENLRREFEEAIRQSRQNEEGGENIAQ